jgi:hypothetical protein
MFENHREVRYVLPDEKVLILADCILYEAIPEFTAARASMLVDDTACGRQDAFPSPLPGLVREVRIFDIERMI